MSTTLQALAALPPSDNPYLNRNPGATVQTVAFRAGRALQSSELNELQTILSNRGNAFSQTVFANGQILTGSQIVVLVPNTVTITIASPAVVSWAAHGLSAGSPVIFSTSDNLPTGIVPGQLYFVIAAGLTSGAFQFSATLGGSAVNTSGSQSGTQAALSNSIQVTDGTVFIQGGIYNIDGTALPIPMNNVVTVGLRMQNYVITEEDDPTLESDAETMRGFGEPGAARALVEFAWGWAAIDGSARDGLTSYDSWFPIYTVENGTPVIKTPTTAQQPLQQMIASYDFKANGNYITNGLILSFTTTSGSNYIYDLSAGSANVTGNAVSLATDSTLQFATDPDTKTITNEVQIYAEDVNNQFTFIPKYQPIASVTSIIGTKQATSEAVVRGTVAGTQDVLANSGVEAVISVVQGGTTYINPTDYIITGGNIDWSPSGAEPTSGSTYDVTYQYLVTPTPDSSTPTALVFSGLVPGSSLIVSYVCDLPRIDALCIAADGTLTKVKGVSQQANPQPPTLGNTQTAIAYITYDWVNDPAVMNTGVRAVQMWELQVLRDMVWDLFDTVAQLELQLDIAQKSDVVNYGIWTDPFKDDSLRDMTGYSGQNAVIRSAVINGQMSQVLTLPVQSINVMEGDNTTNVNSAHVLPFTEEVVIQQPDKTECMLINPFQSFTPPEAQFTLTPDVDHYVEVNAYVVSDMVTYATAAGNNPNHPVTGTTISQSQRVLDSQSTTLAYMRQISVTYAIQGMIPTEAIQTMAFNGVDITPSPTVYADSTGAATGTFTVPADMPSGTRLVAFTGAGGSWGNTTYTGDQTIITEDLQIITQYVNTTRKDPLAETFVLPEPRMITSIDIKFCAKGTLPVTIQIRNVTAGFPDSTVYAQTMLLASSLVADGRTWTNFPFPVPVALNVDTTYAIVVMTDDPAHSVAIATLGEAVQAGDGPNAPNWEVAQPYVTGVLLESSNGETWTPLQASDLTFRLNAAVFSPTTNTVPFGNIPVTNVTDYQVLANVLRPSALCDAQFSVSQPASSIVNTGYENQLFQLSARITDTLGMSVALSGERNLSPIVFEVTQLLTGNLVQTANYVGDAFNAEATFNGRVVYNSYCPGSSTITPTMLTTVDSTPTWAPMNLISRTPIGNGWYEDTYELTGSTGAGVEISSGYSTRVQLSLNGTPAYRPMVQDLRSFAFPPS